MPVWSFKPGARAVPMSLLNPTLPMAINLMREGDKGAEPYSSPRAVQLLLINICAQHAFSPAFPSALPFCGPLEPRVSS